MDLYLLASGRKFGVVKSDCISNNGVNVKDVGNALNEGVVGAIDATREMVVSLGTVMPEIQKCDVTFEESSEDVSDFYLVRWDSIDDPLNPKNWPMWKKWIVVVQISLIAFVVTFGSSVYSSGIGNVSMDFGASIPVSSLGSCVFLVGFGFGSLPFAPLSGIYGRFVVYFCTLLMFTLFQIGGGCAQNIWTLVILRFFQGFFGSTPLSNCGGTLSDLFTPIQRTYVLPGFCTFPFLGPIFGPIIGDFICQSYLGWRWVFWINMIMGAVVIVIIFFFMPETHGDTILDYKARYLRNKTRNMKWHTIHERQRNPRSAIYQACTDSVSLLITEPIVVCFTLYLTVVYIIVYIDFEGYPIVFAKYSFDQGEIGLSFIGIGIGIVLAGACTPIIYLHYNRVYTRRNGVMSPEDRLYPLFFGSIMLPISMFWFAWTCYPYHPYVHWIVPLISSIFFGWSLLFVFFVSYNYIIDSYQKLAASALAAATLVRYAASGGMSLVGRPMYVNLGDHWATTLLGFISVGMIPIPFLFFIYGKKIRGLSKHAYKL